MSLRFNAQTGELDLGELAANQPELGSGVVGFGDAEVVLFQNSVGGQISIFGIVPPINAGNGHISGQLRKLFVFTAGVSTVKFFNESGSAASPESRIKNVNSIDFSANPQTVMEGIYRGSRWWLYAIGGNLQDGAHRAILLWGNNGLTATTTTRFLTPGYTDGLAPTTVVQFRVPSGGVLRNLRVRHNTGAGNGNNIVYTVRVNGVATTIIATLASTANDGDDLVNTAVVADGDLVDIQVTKAVAVGTSPSDITATLDLASV